MNVDQDATELEYITPDTGLPASEAGEKRPVGDNDETDLDDAEGQFETDEDAEQAEDEDEAEKSDEEDSEDEFEEIEHSGRKHKIHKDLKPLLMMQADYTRKTQEVAEKARTVEQEKATVEQQRQFIEQQVQIQRQNLKEYAQLATLDQRLEQYANVDWAKWERDDFLAAQTGWREYQQAKDARQNLASNLHNKEQQAYQEHHRRSLEAQRAAQTEHAKRAEETVKILQRDIKGWTPEHADKLRKFALSLGYTEQEMWASAHDPRPFKLLHKAWQAEQLLAKQKAGQTSRTEQAKPLTQVTRGRTAPAKAGLDDRLSAEEWVRRRNEQVRNRA